MQLSFIRTPALFGLVVLLTGTSAEDCTGVAADGDAYVSLLQTGIEMSRVVTTDDGIASQPANSGLAANAAAAEPTEPNAASPLTGQEINDAHIFKGTRAEAAGVKMNAEGDLCTFLAALIGSIVMVAMCVGFFVWIKDKYPKTYMRGVETNPAPLNVVPEGFFGWTKAAWAADTESIVNVAGLDMAMQIEFTHLAMRIFTIIGIPMFFIMGPVHYFFGGHNGHVDSLSYMSFGTIVEGSSLHWIHALIVWAVVAVVQTSVFKFQRKFLEYRYNWMHSLPQVRAGTVLVEGIPEEHQSDAKLRDFFEKMFGAGSIASSMMVKDAPDLEALCTKRDAIKDELDQANFKSKDEAVEAETKQELLGYISKLEEQYAFIQKEVRTMQDDVRKKSDELGSAGYNTSVGFVTFKKRTDVAFALDAQYSKDADEWNVSVPPPANDIRWHDLQQHEVKSAGFTLLGYALAVSLFFLYMPAVVWMSQIAVTINLNHFGSLIGRFQPLWAAFAPTVGLQIMVCMLPTFLFYIFQLCFSLKAEVFAQLQLQNWYFLFQLVFVVLVVAIGHSVGEFVTILATAPMQVFSVFGETMPNATHFYMKYATLQWLTHAMVLTRYVQLGKYLFFRTIFGEEKGLELSEPEDQQYYGIGSRSARQTILVTIGLVYGTICPPINLLVFVDFYVERVIYGYLVTFAETRKPDTGGYFWVHQLRNVFVGTLVYCSVMVGVLIGRGSSNGPAIIAAPSILYVLWSMRKLERGFLWQRLPVKDLIDNSASSKTKQESMTFGAEDYMQPIFK